MRKHSKKFLKRQKNKIRLWEILHAEKAICSNCKYYEKYPPTRIFTDGQCTKTGQQVVAKEIQINNNNRYYRMFGDKTRGCWRAK